MTIIKLIKNHKLEVILFFLFFVLSAPFISEICSGYLRFAGLDLQEFLLWNYSSANGIVPYKDLFYPYGIANYFRNLNQFFELIYFMLSPLIFTCLFSVFKKIYKNELFSFITVFFLYLFVLLIVGFDTFTRYGIFISYSLITVYALFQNRKISRIKLIGIGLLSGLIFSFFNDIGTYTVIVLIISYGLFSICEKKSLMQSVKEVLVLLAGFVLGIIPLFLFLISKSSLLDFFAYFPEVKNIAEVAKTPFFSFITSPSNLFTLSTLFLAIFYLLYKFSLLKEKIGLLSVTQLVLILDILLLEQKSIIRSIDLQITFVSFILLAVIFFELIKTIKQKNKYFGYSLILVFVLLMFGITSNAFWTNKYLNFNKSLNSSLNNTCFEDNLKTVKHKNSSLEKVFLFLTKEKNFNGKVFSFPPGSAGFYVLFKNKPPYYNAVYESSSKISQENSIKYIKDNKILYIVLDTSTSAVQDGVPDFIRVGTEFKFIINNYYPIKAIGDYIILERAKDKDFFDSEVVKNTSYMNYLLKVYFYKIPFSEGIYKYESLKKNAKLLGTVGTEKISSNKKVIVLIPSVNLSSTYLNTIKLTTADGRETSIMFNTCKIHEPCIINLSNIPLFYKERIISHIAIDNEFKGRVDIYDLQSQTNLW